MIPVGQGVRQMAIPSSPLQWHGYVKVLPGMPVLRACRSQEHRVPGFPSSRPDAREKNGKLHG